MERADVSGSEDIPPPREDEIARIADEYFLARKNGVSISIESFLRRYPHLGDELRESLEAIDLLSTPAATVPRTLVSLIFMRKSAAAGWVRSSALLSDLTASSRRQGRADFVRQTVGRRTVPTRSAVVAVLRHDHIVPIHTVGQVEDWHYYAMDLIDGQSRLLNGLPITKQVRKSLQARRAGATSVSDVLRLPAGERKLRRHSTMRTSMESCMAISNRPTADRS